MIDSKVNAILELMEDPSEEVKSMMETQLKKFSIDELSELRDSAGVDRMELSFKVDVIIQEKIYDCFIEEMELLISAGKADLETMCFYISRFIDNNIQDIDILHKLDELADECREYTEKYPSLKKGEALIRFLADECGFKGNTKSYYAVGNCSIDILLKEKVGLPITLSVLYMLIGRRLNIPVAGVALPGHFVIGVFEDSGTTYFDPFKQGAVLTENECLSIASRSGYPFTEDCLNPADERLIFLRILNNLKLIYAREDKNDEEGVITVLIKLWSERVFREV